MNENERKDELLNEEQINDNTQVEKTEETTAASSEGPKYYIPPHDDGWRPYDPSPTFSNNWDYKNKKKNGARKKALVFGIVRTALTLFAFSVLRLLCFWIISAYPVYFRNCRRTPLVITRLLKPVLLWEGIRKQALYPRITPSLILI